MRYLAVSCVTHFNLRTWKTKQETAQSLSQEVLLIMLFEILVTGKPCFGHHLSKNTVCKLATTLLGADNTPAELFEGRLGLNPHLNLTWVSFSCVPKHFLG